MLPVGLRYIIAKPLVGYFVGEQRFHFAIAFYGVLRIKYGAGIFHAAEDGFGLHVGQLAIRVRPYILYKKGAMTIFVLCNDKPVGGNAFITDGIPMRFSHFGLGVDMNGFILLGKMYFVIVLSYGGYRHPLAIGFCFYQVKIKTGSRLQEFN